MSTVSVPLASAPVPTSSVDTFALWRNGSRTWPEFKAWIQQVETSIEILEFDDSPYVILKTGKDSTAEKVDDTGSSYPLAAQLFRSVVWDTRTNLPCSVAPFSARRDQKIPTDAKLCLEDFVEGVMINIFRTSNDSQTHVTTRSRLDADGTFYSDRSFSELFEEAMDTKKTSLTQIEQVMGEPYLAVRDNMRNVSSVFMSLVLAHPEHRVVRSVEKANFWAIYRGVVYDDGMVEFYTDDLPPSWRPKTYPTTATSWADVKKQFDQIKAGKPWYWQGLVAYQAAQTEPAARWRFRNGDHDRVRRELRGMESNSFGRFLRLRANKRVQEYLRIYSEDNTEFQGFETQYRAVTRTLYQWYCACHKEHSIVFKSLSKAVQPLVFGLHKHYLETLRPAGKSLRLTETIEWLTGHLKTSFGVSNLIRLSKDEGSNYDAWVARRGGADDTIMATEPALESASV